MNILAAHTSSSSNSSSSRQSWLQKPHKTSGSPTTVAALLLTLVLAGCADHGGIAPEAKPRPLSSLDVGRAIAQAGSEAGWPTRSWWEKYGDPQLNRLITAALADNPDMAMAAARVRQAQSLAQATEANESPQVTLDASIGRKNWSANPYYGGGAYRSTDTWNNTALFNMSYNPDLWGLHRSATARAEDQLHAVAADARAAQLDLQANVVRAYVTLRLQYGLLDNAVTILAHQEQILALARRRLKGGIGTELEVSEAQIPLPDTRRQIEAFNENIALTRNQLAALIGQGPGAGDTIARPSMQLNAPVSLPSVLPAELLGRRPDISAARWRIASAARNIDTAKAAFYPNVNLLASIGPMAAGGGMLSFLTANNVSTTFGPAISLPIFEGGRLRAQLGAAAAGYDIEVERYNQLLTSALKNIADQIVTLRSLRSQTEQANLAVATARKNLDIATRAYQRGLTGYLNVLNAQTQLLRQEQIIQQLQARHFTAYASLTTALGGGLEVDLPSADSGAP